MEHWLDTVYSDGTPQFVSPAEPSYGDTVTVRIRLAEDAPVRHVLLRTEPNGIEYCTEMVCLGAAHGLAMYEGSLRMTETVMRYRFYLVCEDAVWYYNQRGVTDSSPDRVHDFILLTEYRQPVWVKNAVFYQIFPERFCNGDPSLDVRDGELVYDGHSSIHMDWEQAPLCWQDGHCMDFFGGDLDGIRKKIPYLKKLGVTALYLNPIFRAPSTHRYDCVDYFHVDPHLGGDEALARLSTALHENGMRLVLDISINHTGISHRWFNKDCAFFDKTVGAWNSPEAPERAWYFFKPGTNEYKGWAGVDTMPVLDYRSETLRDILYRGKDSVIRKWLRPPYSIDGWRFDVADVMARNDEVQLSHEVWQELCAAIREENPEAYILAEDWGDCTEYLQGTQYDAPMNYYGCARIIRQFMGGKDLYMDRSPVFQAVNRTITAEMVEKRVSGFLAKQPYVLAQNQFNLLNSHDVPRLQHMGHMTAEKLRGAALLMFMLPGAPSIYYGDEAAIGGWTETTEGCRFPMPWHTDIEATAEYALYSTLASLKKREPALREGGMKFIFARGKVLAIARFTAESTLVAVVSASDDVETVVLPLSSIGAEGPADRVDLLGRPVPMAGRRNGELTLVLKPGEALLFPCKML